MNDRRTGLIVLLLADPRLLEGTERRHNRSANPCGVLALGWGNDLELGGNASRAEQLLEFELQALGNAGEHGATASEHNAEVSGEEVEVRAGAAIKHLQIDQRSPTVRVRTISVRPCPS